MQRHFLRVLPALCVFFFFIAKAQQPLLVNYSVKDGLPSSEVYDVLQDHEGYIWFATDAGVCRYDGYRFHNYSTADGLPDNTIFGITEDRHGRIWFRSYSGKISWFYNDTIHTIPANARIVKEKKNSMPLAMAIDEGDTLWCGYSAFESYIQIAPPYDEQHVRVIPYNTSGNYRICVHTVGPANYFISYTPSKKNGILFFNGQRPARSIDDTHPLSGDGFAKFCPLPDGSFFFAQANTGMIAGKNSVKPVPLPSSRILIARTVANGTWLGFSSAGAWFYPGGNFTGAAQHFLDGYSVTNAMYDREGGTWLTTLENGVYYLPPGNIRYYNKTTGFPDNKIKSLYITASGAVLTGCANGYVCRIEKDSVYALSPKSMFTANMLSIDSVAPGKFFISSNEPVICSLNGKEKQGLAWQGKPVQQLDIFAFVMGKNGWGWSVSREELLLIDVATATIKKKYTLPNRFTGLCLDENEVLWLGALNGLWSFENDSFIYHGNENPLLASRIESMCMDHEGRMWMATRGAGVLVKDKTGHVTAISSRDGLASDICRSVFIDAENNSWVATNNGISRIRELHGKFSADSYDPGETRFGEVNCIRRYGDTLWAATGQGLIRFPIKKDNVRATGPPVHITAITINGDAHRAADEEPLSFHENFISISFTGISYKAQGRLRYCYRLEGLDTAWHYTSGREIQFTTLPPGRYTFAVYAISPDGKKSAAPATWSFYIIPPFWKQWWFITVCAIVIISGALLYMQLRLKKEREKQMLAGKMTELELAALRAQMNPHFIFNAMNSIQHFVLSNDQPSAQKYLTKFSRLMRGILEHSRHRAIPLSDEIQALELYMELEVMRSGFRFTYHIEVDPAVDRERLRIQPMLVQPYIENAILHGIFPLEDRKGHLEITFRLDGRFLVCTIDDNGIGRAKAKENKERRRQAHSSAGMSITARRLEMLNEGVGISIEDKMDEQQNPCGTRVELHIPF